MPTNMTIWPRVVGAIEYCFSDGPSIRENYDGTIPEGFMDELQTFLGDGQAKVGAGADIGILNFGTGVKVNFHISVTCGQDQANISAATSFVTNQSMRLAKWYYEIAEQQFKQMLSQRNRLSEYVGV